MGRQVTGVQTGYFDRDSFGTTLLSLGFVFLFHASFGVGSGGACGNMPDLPYLHQDLSLTLHACILTSTPTRSGEEQNSDS